ncbi:hypothetical protein OSB04_un001334 [Centaurea solstitialis]|uniref:DUF4283 domain-containing protein n=1 Tax=Centaurea solstitialis TaxID=347529 RepID=A0AA38VUQ7_9ASTR|nr:hypothetical protein OSB04_un001334 [Centaurea solstitialis]
MKPDRPPDPPMTRNRTRKSGKNKGSASPTLAPPSPATTAAMPACGGDDVDRPSGASSPVVAGCQKNTTAAALFFASDSPTATPTTATPPLAVAPLLPDAKQPPTPPPPPLGGGSTSQQPPAADGAGSGLLAVQAKPAHAGFAPPPGDTSTTVPTSALVPPVIVAPEKIRDWNVDDQKAWIAKAYGTSIHDLKPFNIGSPGSNIVGFTTTKPAMETSSLKGTLGRTTGFFDVTKPPPFTPVNEESMNVDGVGDEEHDEGINNPSMHDSMQSVPTSHESMQQRANDVHGDVEKPLPNDGNYVDDKDQVHLHGEANEQVKQKAVSFAELLKKSANLLRGKGKITYYPPVVSELGTRRAIIPDELIHKQASEWALTLAGYFVGKRPAFPFVQFHARRLWKKFGLTKVILNDQGYFFFKFSSEQGLNFVFENGPWLFNGMPIFIQKWEPDLCFDKPEPKRVPLWVNIYGLPLDVWDLDILSYLASVVGEPISVDRYTEEMCETKSGRANFARILVNASADYDLPTEIDAIILGKLRKFRTEFLWKPKRCSHCKLFGHDLDSCIVKPIAVIPGKSDKPLPSVTCVGESSKAKAANDGFSFPKRKNNPKPKLAPLKIGSQKPKVTFATGIKLNQRYVPKANKPSIDPLDKGKAVLDDTKVALTNMRPEKTPIKVSKIETEKMPSPIKVSNQFVVLEEDPEWIADKKEVDDFVENRGVGLEPAIVNSWSKQKLDYFIGRWERVYGKDLDGKLRGFTLPERVVIPDDIGDESESDDDVSSDQGGFMDDMAKETPYGTWLRQKQEVDRRIAEKRWPTRKGLGMWTEKQVDYFFKQCEMLPESDRQLIPVLRS